MAHRLERGQRELWNSLTVLKLSLQVLERRTELSTRQQELVSSALTAADRLTTLPLTTARPVMADGRLSGASPQRSARNAARASLPRLLWRYAWPFGKRAVAGATRLVFAPRLAGLRARCGTRQPGFSGPR
jgi:hypothetical protein